MGHNYKLNDDLSFILKWDRDDKSKFNLHHVLHDIVTYRGKSIIKDYGVVDLIGDKLNNKNLYQPLIPILENMIRYGIAAEIVDNNIWDDEVEWTLLLYACKFDHYPSTIRTLGQCIAYAVDIIPEIQSRKENRSFNFKPYYQKLLDKYRSDLEFNATELTGLAEGIEFRIDEVVNSTRNILDAVKADELIYPDQIEHRLDDILFHYQQVCSLRKDIVKICSNMYKYEYEYTSPDLPIAELLRRKYGLIIEIFEK